VEVQLVNYFVATGKPLGLILNFGERKKVSTFVCVSLRLINILSKKILKALNSGP